MLSIPIVSSFNNKGIKKAIQEFKQLEGAGEKAKFGLEKALIPATAALGGLGAALFDATKGAIEDEAASDKLAQTLKRVAGATDNSIKKAEEWITQQGKNLGFSDDKLRPALGRLSTATGDVTKAQDLLQDAMDIATQKGLPLETVTKALEKAYGGNLTALQKLDPSLRDNIKAGDTFEEIMAELAKTTGGAAADAANTAQGKFDRFGIALGETKESIGASLLPAVEAVLPYLQNMADWASKNPQTFTIIAGAIAGIAAAIVAINIAMSLNPLSLIAIGVGLIIAAVVIAYKKFEGFRGVVDTLFGAMKWWINNVTIPAIEGLLKVFKVVFNGIASLWNNSIGKLSFKFPSFVPGFGGKGFDVPNIPMLADGGIVRSATLAVIGEAGPEAVVPLSRAGEFGMGGGNNVTIHVNGGDPQAVVAALRTYMRQNGSVPIRVSNIF
jgi:prepilin signal peptidase PulO-like enzyme (type II secretory pathway)